MKKLLSALALGAAFALPAHDFSVAVKNGVPQLVMDGQPATQRTYFGQILQLIDPRMKDFHSTVPHQAKLAREAGVRIISIKIYCVWAPDGPAAEYGYRRLDTLCQAILKEVPDAQLLFRVGLNASDRWRKAHPDEVARYEDGTLLGDATISSQLYRKEAREALRRTIRYLEKNYPNNIAGYHPAGQNSSEWFYVGSHSHKCFGYAPADVTAFRAFLTKKYGTDAKLQSAWQDAKATLATVTIPTSAERQSRFERPLREPAVGADKRLLDHAEFLNEEMADTVLELAHVIREECGKKRLSVLFYGYLFELSGMWNGPCTSGHLALRRILNSPDVDVLSAPFSYNDRQLGGTAPVMTAAESVALAGKIWLNEDDTRTAKAAENSPLPRQQQLRTPGWPDGGNTHEETKFLLRRNLSAVYARNFATWWMDLYGHGWYDEPLYWQDQKLFAPVEKLNLENPRRFAPPAAMIVDPVSQHYLISGGASPRTFGATLSVERKMMGRLGTPYGQYMLDDIMAGKADPKLNVYCGIVALNGTQRKALRERAKRTASIWFWNSGLIDLDTGKYSLKAVEELTGFQVKYAGEGATLTAFATEYGKKRFGLPSQFGQPQKIGPFLSPIPEKGDEVLAVYATGEPAVVLRRKGAHSQLFCGIAKLPLQLYRSMAKLANCPIYVEPFAAVFANGDFLAVTATDDNTYTINTGKPGKYTDLLTGKALGEGPKFKVTLKKGETVIPVLRQEGRP